jgi:type IV pilus assembly protein PilO
MNSGMRHIIFFIMIIAMVYVSYAYMIRPANEYLTQQRMQMEASRAKLEELRRATAASEDLSVQLEQMEKIIREFESKLPPSSEIHTVLENVTLIAQRHGLVPKMIRTLKTSTKGGYIEQPLEMELHGDFNSYYAFLLELERLDRITKIRQLELKKKSKYEGQTEAKFIMSIFFQNTKA